MQLPPSVRLVKGNGGLDRLDVSTASATAQVYLHGGHVAAWQPSQADAGVIWLSGHSLFQPDKAIRGGVPVCFPWFGPHPGDPGAPAHGFARLADWTLAHAAESPDATVTLVLSLDAASRPQHAVPAVVVYRISVGTRLTMSLEVTNRGDEPWTFEEALHTYLAVADIEQVSVTGLENTDYLDKVAGFARRRQGGDPIRFSGETDRVYLATRAECIVHDPRMGRRIVVSKSGSGATVVWNPWSARARELPDFGDDEWRAMVCVETANVGDAAVRLEPGGSHVMTAGITVEAGGPAAGTAR